MAVRNETFKFSSSSGCDFATRRRFIASLALGGAWLLSPPAVHPAFNSVFPGPQGGGVNSRRYTRISDMARDGIDARTFGGMHFPGASAATAAVGAQIAEYILANAAKPI